MRAAASSPAACLSFVRSRRIFRIPLYSHQGCAGPLWCHWPKTGCRPCRDFQCRDFQCRDFFKGSRVCLLLQAHPGETATPGFQHQKQEAGGGKRKGKSFGANIREAVALGVAGVKARLSGQIDAERVGRAEAGPFPNQDNRHICPESECHFVAGSDPALLHKHSGADAPVLPAQFSKNRP